MFDKLKTLVGLQTKDEREHLFDSSTAINAGAAYMTTKYGRNCSREQLLRDFFKNTNDRIKTKTMQNEYCCMVEIDSDILPYKDIILKRYGEELGYNIALIQNGTKISQPGTQPVEINPDSTFIILMWNNADLGSTDELTIHIIDDGTADEPQELPNQADAYQIDLTHASVDSKK